MDAEWEFRHLTRDDLPMLAQWLAEPPVYRWWHQEHSPEAMDRDFGPGADRSVARETWIGWFDGRPTGMIQRVRVHDEPTTAAAFAGVGEVPRDAVTFDYLLGNPDQRARGLGSSMIRAMVARTWEDHPDTNSIIVVVNAANGPSWGMLAKVGFHRCSEGEMTPDNPIDERLHYMMRLDRGSSMHNE